MNVDIALFLFQDGIINAAIYALLALALVLVFTVTRIIFVPQGEFITFGALTLASMQQGLFPATVYVAVVLGFIAGAYELIAALRAKRSPAPWKMALFVVYPGVLWLLLRGQDLQAASLLVQIALTMAIVVPLGPMLYRVVFQPLANTTVLVLLIASVAAHLVLVGVGLLAFGPEGSRTTPLSDAVFSVGPLIISGQSLVMVIMSLVLIAGLAWAFSATLFGKALRATAVNRAGARLVGIRPEMSGQLCFLLAAVVGVLSGILISPLTTVYYDTGFTIALKGFVAAIIGGLASYPVAAAGAVFVGMLESFSSFWASSFKEVIVFSLIIPVLLWRSLTSNDIEEEGE
ncbi:MAG: branched-chain amino acid ABC transporter permease [Aquisalimonadaceae bacterium]